MCEFSGESNLPTMQQLMDFPGGRLALGVTFAALLASPSLINFNPFDADPDVLISLFAAMHEVDTAGLPRGEACRRILRRMASTTRNPLRTLGEFRQNLPELLRRRPEGGQSALLSSHALLLKTLLLKIDATRDAE
jgi:hypothetical protein